MLAVARKLVRFLPLYPKLKEWRNVRALRSWGPQDAQRLEFYRGLIRPADLVFDIGANLGNRSKVFLRLGARVVAFEPQSYCVKILRQVLAAESGFQLVQKALGDEPGVAELRVSAMHVLSTLSDQWIGATSESGRFRGEKWEQREQVSITTFDEAIREFGTPAFAKVDVEGFEQQVFAGLSQPIGGGSFEFAAEFLNEAIACVERLSGVAPYRFQFSSGESMHFDWPQWVSLREAADKLHELARSDRYAWGDVYFRAGA